MVVFHWPDYLVFSILLIFYAFIGLIFKLKYDSGTKQSAMEYFLANRKMTLIPVTASILVSFLSADSILGNIAEVYVNGVEFTIIGLAFIFAIPLAAFIYLPIFYKLNIVSIHEYLELRFSRLIRVMISIVFVIQMVFFISVVLYAPALVFSQVSGFSIWISILTTGIVCTFYTTIGGMRTVIWTDLMQFVIMLIGILTVVIVGTNKIGGISVVWDIAKKTDHLKLFNFNANPFTRHSFWSLFIGGTGMCLSIFATNQAQVQRYLSCRSEQVAIRALLLNIPFTCGFFLMLITAGLVTYSSLISCDPLSRGFIQKNDQIFPFFVVQLLKKYFPLPGLFMSSLFAAALSTMSSGINSLSGVIMKDLMILCSTRFQRDESLYSKLIVLVLGVSTILLAFLFSFVSSTVLQISMSLFGMAGGPILSVFTMGLVIPCVNEKGALVGLIGSLIATLWLGIGAIVRNPIVSRNITNNMSDCVNFTINRDQPVTAPNDSQFSFYNLSYLYYTLVAIIVCTILSVSVSALTGFNSKRKIDKKLLFLIVPKLSKYYPARFRSQIKDENEDVGEKKRFLTSVQERGTKRINQISV